MQHRLIIGEPHGPYDSNAPPHRRWVQTTTACNSIVYLYSHTEEGITKHMQQYATASSTYTAVKEEGIPRHMLQHATASYSYTAMEEGIFRHATACTTEPHRLDTAVRRKDYLDNDRQAATDCSLNKLEHSSLTFLFSENDLQGLKSLDGRASPLCIRLR